MKTALEIIKALAAATPTTQVLIASIFVLIIIAFGLFSFKDQIKAMWDKRNAEAAEATVESAGESESTGVDYTTPPDSCDYFDGIPERLAGIQTVGTNLVRLYGKFWMAKNHELMEHLYRFLSSEGPAHMVVNALHAKSFTSAMLAQIQKLRNNLPRPDRKIVLVYHEDQKGLDQLEQSIENGDDYSYIILVNIGRAEWLNHSASEQTTT